jgi:hypothetical protein
MAAFWTVAPCNLIKVWRRFRGSYCPHDQGDDYTAPYPRKVSSFYSPPWEPEISHPDQLIHVGISFRPSRLLAYRFGAHVYYWNRWRFGLLQVYNYIDRICCWLVIFVSFSFFCKILQKIQVRPSQMSGTQKPLLWVVTVVMYCHVRARL